MGCSCSSDPDGLINPWQVDQSHFSMMKVVGKGGFGKVNAVTHRATGKLMAMKRMKKAKLVSKKMYVVTAWRERDVMAQLKSPFLVNLIYAFQDAENLFLIMPFMQGGDLRYYLSTKGRMLESDCRFYAAEMILGLQELHSLNIVYRDLKPDNVLLDDTGCGPDGIEEVKRHKWFAGLDWEKMNTRELKPPFQPELDRANCSADFELQDQFFAEKKEPDLSDEQHALFRGYDYNVDFSIDMLPENLKGVAMKEPKAGTWYAQQHAKAVARGAGSGKVMVNSKPSERGLVGIEDHRHLDIFEDEDANSLDPLIVGGASPAAKQPVAATASDAKQQTESPTAAVVRSATPATPAAHDERKEERAPERQDSADVGAVKVNVAGTGSIKGQELTAARVDSAGLPVGTPSTVVVPVGQSPPPMTPSIATS